MSTEPTPQAAPKHPSSPPVADGPATAEQLGRYRHYLLAEWEAAALYRRLADAEPVRERASVLRELAVMEEMHAARWRAKLEAAGASLPPWKPSRRSGLLGWLASRFGTRFVLPILEHLEGGDADMYAAEPGAEDFSLQERAHARIFARLGERRRSPASIAEREGGHRGAGGGSLRAAVFGVNDGLVSNLSLVMGVAGADPGPGFILLAGLAGLLAGAFSMATGEYVSMRTQRELLERELEIERVELQENPEEEEQELALIYRAKGLDRDEAESLAKRLIGDKATALDTLAREELGLDPSELGSPWGAATSSFLAFTAGAFVPVLPYLLAAGPGAFAASAGLSAVALAGVGMTTAAMTGKSLLLGGGRMLLLGAAAATVTYLLGRLLGVTVAG